MSIPSAAISSRVCSLVNSPSHDLARVEGLDEQRLVEHGAELADAALAVDERDLAEADRAVVELQSPPHDLRALLRVDRHGAAAFEPDLEPADDRPVEKDERPRRTDVPLR